MKMSFSGEQRMNLTALKRVDSTITNILDHASQVALYKFNHKANEWEKTQIEGTLFVYTRPQQPQNGFIVMNRLSTQNLMEPITPGLEFQLQTPFLLYKNSTGTDGQINGIWFYDNTECSRVEAVLNRLCDNGANLKRQRSASESDKKHRNINNNHKNMNNGDILALLHQAQEEYDKLQSTKLKGQEPKPFLAHPLSMNNRDLIKPTPVRAFNGLSPKEPFKEAPKSPVSLSLASLFAQATQHQNNSMMNSLNIKLNNPVGAEQRIPTLPPPQERSQLLRLMSNPANTLEHIEKQQLNELQKEPLPQEDTVLQPQGGKVRNRATSCSSQMGLCTVGKPPGPLSLHRDTQLGLDRHTSVLGPVTKSVPITIPPPSSSLDVTLMTPDMFEINPQFAQHTPSLSPNFGVGSLDSLSQSLLSPLVFEKRTPTISNGKLSQGVLNSTHAVPRVERLSSSLVKESDSLLEPVQSKVCSSRSSTANAMALTRDQLRESLLYLLQNDDSFLNSIHEGYLASLKSHLVRS